MDQGGNRRRAFHGVGQPSVEEELRRLPHRADEQQHAGQIQRRPIRPDEPPGLADKFWNAREYLRKLDGPDHPVDRHDAERETEIPHAIDHESLDSRRIGRVFVVPEPDQQITGQSNALPTEEKLHEVGGGHQGQHGEGE